GRGQFRANRVESSGAFDARVLQPVRDLVLAVDEDRVVRTGLLALAAAGAVLLDDRHDPEEARRILDGDHLQRLERAALDALLATGAALLVDERDRPFGLLEQPLHVSVLVEDGIDRTDRTAGAAVDAQLGRDQVQRFALAGDRVRRAALDRRRAADARRD